MKQLPYREGAWFAVPLRGGGYGVGVVARMAPTGRVLTGYFFGPKRAEAPSLDELRRARPDQAVLVQRFGDLHLVDEKWPILGYLDDWRRDDWPMPAFGRHVEIDEKAWRVEYQNDNPNSVPRETRISVEESQRLPDDGLLGAGLVEIMLTRLLGDQSAKSSLEN